MYTPLTCMFFNSLAGLVVVRLFYAFARANLCKILLINKTLRFKIVECPSIFRKRTCYHIPMIRGSLKHVLNLGWVPQTQATL